MDRVMVFNTTFNNISVISWWSILQVKETGVSGEIHRYGASPLRIILPTTEIQLIFIAINFNILVFIASIRLVV